MTLMDQYHLSFHLSWLISVDRLTSICLHQAHVYIREVLYCNTMINIHIQQLRRVLQ